MKKRTKIRLALGGVVAALTLALTAAIAQAHVSSVWNRGDYMSVSSDHKRMSVCDRSGDGRYATGWAWLRNGSLVSVDDRRDRYCSTGSFSSTIRKFQLCKNAGSYCTTWRWA